MTPRGTPLAFELVVTAAFALVAGACAFHANDDAPRAPTSDEAGPSARPLDPGPGGVLFTASGEVLARTGYAFPPAREGDPVLVDGWQLTFTRVLTTIGRVTLSENPDTAPGDQSQTGAVVAEIDGPWAFDLSRADPTALPGKGGPGEIAVPFAALSTQNRNGDAPFKTDGTRYAFGFDVVTATPTAKMVNLDAPGIADYGRMIEDRCAVLYVGTATFKGNKQDPACYPAGYDKWPDVVNFRFCFASPTTYANCQNPDNDPAASFPDEEHLRGIAFKPNASVIAQVTMHLDHPFWDSVLHDSPAHFDVFAARARADAQTVDGGAPTVTLDGLKGVDYTGYTDALGHKLAWRYCIEPPTDVHPKFTGPMALDPQTVPHAIGGDPKTGLRDAYDFVTYNQSTQGHLNSDGLCAVKRDYDSPR